MLKKLKAISDVLKGNICTFKNYFILCCLSNQSFELKFRTILHYLVVFPLHTLDFSLYILYVIYGFCVAFDVAFWFLLLPLFFKCKSHQMNVNSRWLLYLFISWLAGALLTWDYISCLVYVTLFFNQCLYT